MIVELPVAHRSLLSRSAKPAVWLAMPLLGLANQYCAEQVAHALMATPWGMDWFITALGSHWMQAWAILEIVTLTIWIIVLSELPLSAAFPMTAIGYVLVVGMGWIVLGEPIHPLQLVGGAAILGGVWLMSQDEP
jgi:drug/metabolite transporter (DMT)-like permease